MTNMATIPNSKLKTTYLGSPYFGYVISKTDFYNKSDFLHSKNLAVYEEDVNKVKNWRIEASKKGPNSCKIYDEVVPMEEVKKLDQVNNAKLNWYNKFMKSS